MSDPRREPKDQPLGLCFWCDQMTFPGAVRITGAQGYLMLHGECCDRLQQECGAYGVRAHHELVADDEESGS